jgi:hypothetical protein
MKIISHRGNLEGITPDENRPDYVNNTLQTGFDVEVDVWLINNELFLGHDEPQYKINNEFLLNDKLWCHAKNKDAFQYMLNNSIHCFWHEQDKFTLTSKGIPWCYPGNYMENGITVELIKTKIPTVMGICTDYPKNWI